MCGPRVEATVARVADAADAARAGCRFVLIGTQEMQPERLLQALVASELSAPDAGAELCGACEGEGGGGARREAPPDVFARKVAADTRFEVCWRRGDLVAFHLLAWLGAEAETLNRELLAEVNSSASGSGCTWLAPCLDEKSALALICSVGPAADPLALWTDVHGATEQVMLRHFGGVFCHCDCMDALAGQVLV
jgi:hypothetical protein